MPKRGENRITVNLGCDECKERTYHTTKNRRNDPDRLELKNSVRDANDMLHIAKSGSQVCSNNV